MKLDIRDLAAFKATLNAQRVGLTASLLTIAGNVMKSETVMDYANTKQALHALDPQYFDALVWLEMYKAADEIIANVPRPVLADVINAVSDHAMAGFAVRAASRGRIAGPAEAYERLLACLHGLEVADATAVEICNEIDGDVLGNSYEDFKDGDPEVTKEVWHRQVVRFLDGRDPSTIDPAHLEHIRSCVTRAGFDPDEFGLSVTGEETSGAPPYMVAQAIEVGRSLGYEIDPAHVRDLGDGKCTVHLGKDGASTDMAHALDEQGLDTLRTAGLDGGTADLLPGSGTGGEPAGPSVEIGARRSYFPERQGRGRLNIEDIMAHLTGPEGRAPLRAS